MSSTDSTSTDSHELPTDPSVALDLSLSDLSPELSDLALASLRKTFTNLDEKVEASIMEVKEVATQLVNIEKELFKNAELAIEQSKAVEKVAETSLASVTSVASVALVDKATTEIVDTLAKAQILTKAEETLKAKWPSSLSVSEIKNDYFNGLNHYASKPRLPSLPRSPRRF